MYAEIPTRTEHSSRYASQMGKRSRFAWVLTLLLSSFYLGFVLLIAFESELLSASNPASPIVWGLGLVLLLTTFVLAGMHFKRASQDYESMNAERLNVPVDMQPAQDCLMPDARGCSATN